MTSESGQASIKDLFQVIVNKYPRWDRNVVHTDTDDIFCFQKLLSFGDMNSNVIFYLGSIKPSRNVDDLGTRLIFYLIRVSLY